MLGFFPRGGIMPGPGLPKELELYFNGHFLYEGKSISMTATLVDMMGSEWIAAHQRRPEVFAELFRTQRPAKDRYDTNHHAARRFYRFFSRKAEEAGMGVVEFVFDIDPRHSSAFNIEKESDFAVLLALRCVPVEMVAELRELHGKPLKPVLASVFGTGRYKPENAHQERRLCQSVTGSKHAYPLMRAGVPAVNVKALQQSKGGHEQAFDAVTEASFLGVPVTYAVAAALQGVFNPETIREGFENDIAPEYLGAA